MDAVVHPPQPGEPSYELFQKVPAASAFFPFSLFHILFSVSFQFVFILNLVVSCIIHGADDISWHLCCITAWFLNDELLCNFWLGVRKCVSVQNISSTNFWRWTEPNSWWACKKLAC